MNAHNISCKTILVVEDDQGIRDTMRDVLESEGYRVVTAVNGEDGLEKLREATKPCLVLLDMMMPVMNGREMLNIVLADDLLASTPVFFVSAIASAENTEGAAGYLKKPIDLDILFKLINQHTVSYLASSSIP